MICAATLGTGKATTPTATKAKVGADSPTCGGGTAGTSTRGGAGGDAFIAYLRARLPLVEEALATATARPLAEGGPLADLERYLYEPLAGFTAGGGKRVRPILCLLGAEAAGGSAEAALSAGVAVELFQSAALIHDDIADHSEVRHGSPCLYVTQGTGVATNAGDLALTRVFDIVLRDEALPTEHRLGILKELVHMERHTLEGQALDLGWVRDGRWDVTTADYLFMVTSKTAWYSAASPLRIGARAAGALDDVLAGLTEVGRHAGIAFQLQDDLLNLVGNEHAQGKDFRSDITEGKRTLAVVSALEHLEPSEHDELVSLLESKTSDTAELARAVELIDAGGGIARCRTLAEAEAAEAKGHANALVETGLVSAEAGELLRSMADFFVGRSS